MSDFGSDDGFHRRSSGSSSGGPVFEDAHAGYAAVGAHPEEDDMDRSPTNMRGSSVFGFLKRPSSATRTGSPLQSPTRASISPTRGSIAQFFGRQSDGQDSRQGSPTGSPARQVSSGRLDEEGRSGARPRSRSGDGDDGRRGSSTGASRRRSGQAGEVFVRGPVRRAGRPVIVTDDKDSEGASSATGAMSSMSDKLINDVPPDAPPRFLETDIPLRRRLPKGANPKDYFNRIFRVVCTVKSARGLPKLDTWGKSDPYVLVKGIKSDNTNTHVAMTPAKRQTLTPVWDFKFQFIVPDDWGVVELLGLKFVLLDSDPAQPPNILGSDDFIGGVDVDISDLHPGRLSVQELDLGGMQLPVGSFLSKKKRRRPRMIVEITVFREWVPRPETLNVQLFKSLRTYNRVHHLHLKIFKGRFIKPRADVRRDQSKLRDLLVVVRAIMVADGRQAVELHRSRICENTLEPSWNETIRVPFELDSETMVLGFDVYDTKQSLSVPNTPAHTSPSSRGGKPGEPEHIGSGYLHLEDVVWEKKHVKVLLNEALLEKRLNKLGRVPRQGRRQVLRIDTETDRDVLNAPFMGPPQPGVVQRINEKLHDLKAVVGKVGAVAKEYTYGPKIVPDPYLEVEIAVKWNEERMPLCDLLDIPYVIKNEDDANNALQRWKASGCNFQPLQMLQSGKVKEPHELVADGHIIFVSGFLKGASDLPQADLLGKSDPYCLIEASSKTDDILFVHRTKVIQDNLCPAWNEHFHFAVPENFQLARLIFTVLDSDEGEMGQLAFMDDGDDFLGRANVDLSYLRNAQTYSAEFALIGARKSRGQLMAGFRRTSHLIMELNCQRRIMPTLEPMDEDELKKPQRHFVSREPPLRRRYVNPGTLVVLDDGPRIPAMQTMELWTTNKLLELKDKRLPVRPEEDLWLEPPHPSRRRGREKKGEEEDAAQRPRPDEEIEEEPLEDEEKAPSAPESPKPDAHDMSDIPRADWCSAARVKMPRSISVPSLYARYGTTSWAAKTFSDGGGLIQELGRVDPRENFRLPNGFNEESLVKGSKSLARLVKLPSVDAVKTHRH
eukprot:TRINITY_DN91128_c0_g1_i1.p1 TRINITY_DN91128_c0_g1~~TRINITY_DN91128_c0_g1_i1.p1  ORF type:complete len:1074 (-),score=207.00 TRINITY_DN91128_c0_g1_i1:317-3499(-)